MDQGLEEVVFELKVSKRLTNYVALFQTFQHSPYGIVIMVFAVVVSILYFC